MDIWTTSFYSYAPTGVGPGGGLADDTLRVGGWGDLYYSLLQFNLSGLPQNASAVTLSLYDSSAGTGSPVSMNLFQITQPWNWQTMGTGSDHDRLWWADQPSTSPAQQGLPAPTVGTWDNIDITSLYNSWQSGLIPNYGVELQPTSNANEFNWFYSSRAADPTLRPKITITPSISTPPALSSRPPALRVPSPRPVPTTDFKSYAFPIESLSPVYLTTEAGGVSSSNAPVNGSNYGYYDPNHASTAAYFALDLAVGPGAIGTVIAAKPGEIIGVASIPLKVANQSVTIYDGDGYYTRYQEFEVDPSLTVGEDITQTEFEQGFSLGQVRQQDNEHLHFQVGYDPNWTEPGYVPTWQIGLSHSDNVGLQGITLGGKLLTDYKLERDPTQIVNINGAQGPRPLSTVVQGTLPDSALQGAAMPTSAFDSIISPVTSSTGSVAVNGSSLTLQTGSPVWMSTYVSIADLSNYLTFGANFTSEPGAEGLLSVYWGSTLVGTVDERFVSDGRQLYSLALPSDYAIGAYEISFRLDPYTDVQSSVTIDGLATGFSQTVPEPSAMSLGAFSLSSILLRRKRNPGIGSSVIGI